MMTDMNSMTDVPLKSCPFCGSRKVFWAHSNIYARIECEDCGSCGPECVVGTVGPFEYHAETAWNARPIEDGCLTRVGELRTRVTLLEAAMRRLADEADRVGLAQRDRNIAHSFVALEFAVEAARRALGIDDGCPPPSTDKSARKALGLE